ncbi:hypothetical protein [Roseomonas populi]|uniref:Uncharacterized protein n=1 Tax=Roseomonas populi TaxID=3121582 RepID=A0ABT1X329_9PROT|nr:hypothetical protein [Roseomonas pecuniae]MCR0982513.1 hypothetical protein [Roseomonas pecuniae]
MRYRSFGNEAVRNPIPQTPPQQAEEQAFSVLGDALAGVEDLPPDAVMGGAAPVPTEAPMLPVRDSYPTYPIGIAEPLAPDPYAALEMAPPPPVPPEPPQPVPVLPAAQPMAVVPSGVPAAPAYQQAVPAAPPIPAPQPAPLPPAPRPVAVAPEPPASSLLQVLLGGPVQPQPVPPPVPEPVPVPVAPVAPAAPVQVAPVQPPAQPLADRAPPPVPVVPQAAAPLIMPMLTALPAASWPPAGFAGGTGSSLLDTLMGVGAGSSAGTIHYPLLDALGDAMRGTAGEPSPRHWPAARVDIALPELLRRIATGVRFARSAA